MTKSNELRLAVENLTDQLLEEHQAELLVAPDLPPLNIPVANMNATQKAALDYWLQSDYLDYLYIQMMDAQGKTYNTIYFEEDEELAPDLYVSAFESSSGLCDGQQIEKIKLWINQNPQFQGIALENMDDYGVDVSIYEPPNHHAKWIMILTFLLSFGSMIFISTLLGMIIIFIGIFLIFIVYHRNKKLLELKMWHETLASRIESYLEHKIQKNIQQKYNLVDESEKQVQDDNAQEYELSDTMKQAVVLLESSMFIEVEDDKGNKEMKNIAQMKLENELKKENSAL